MSSVAFDTFEFNNTLREAGFDEKQAAALTRAQTKSMEQVHKDADYVSRTELKTDINDLRKDMQSLESGLRKDMQQIEISLRKDMQAMEYRLIIKIGGMIAASIAVLAYLLKMH
jgi:hypothetical protein